MVIEVMMIRGDHGDRGHDDLERRNGEEGLEVEVEKNSFYHQMRMR